MRFRQPIDGGIVRRQAKQIDGEEASHAEAQIPSYADRLSRAFGTEIEAFGVDIGEHRGRADAHDGLGACDIGEGGNDDGVTGPDPEGCQGEFERIGAIRAGNAMLGACENLETPFQFVNFRSEDEASMREDAGERAIDLGSQSPALRGKVDELNSHQNSVIGGVIPPSDRLKFAVYTHPIILSAPDS